MDCRTRVGWNEQTEVSEASTWTIGQGQAHLRAFQAHAYPREPLALPGRGLRDSGAGVPELVPPHVWLEHPNPATPWARSNPAPHNVAGHSCRPVPPHLPRSSPMEEGSRPLLRPCERRRAAPAKAWDHRRGRSCGHRPTSKRLQPRWAKPSPAAGQARAPSLSRPVAGAEQVDIPPRGSRGAGGALPVLAVPVWLSRSRLPRPGSSLGRSASRPLGLGRAATGRSAPWIASGSSRPMGTGAG